MNDHEIETLVEQLMERLGRIPTEKEIIDFINGDDKTRLQIWNQENNK